MTLTALSHDVAAQRDAVVERLICHSMSCERRGSFSSFPALAFPGRNVKLRCDSKTGCGTKLLPRF